MNATDNVGKHVARMNIANGRRAPYLSQIGPAMSRVTRLPKKVAIIDVHICSLERERVFLIS